MGRLRSLWCAFLLVALAIPAVPGAAQSQAPWAQLALADLEEIRRLILANHPGPVDPQNPGYRRWLEQGFAEARRRAGEATSFSDYKRVLRFYATGFFDGHLAVSFPIDAVRTSWPGFVVAEAADGSIRVGTSEEAPIPTGARLIQCDGIEAARLLEERVYPFWWNREIPHQRPLSVPQLLMIDPTDGRFRLQRCDFEIAGGRETRSLRWRTISSDRARTIRNEAFGRVIPELGLRRVGDIWFASIPSFQLASDSEVAAFNRFLAELESRADELRRSTLVIDVRGNGGGVSTWGDRVVERLWGRPWYERVSGSFDNSVDWRVSADNIERNRDVVAQLEHDGLADEARRYRQLVTGMERAQRDGQALYRVDAHPQPIGRPPPNPMRGRVFFLTDDVCFSACLGFADLVRRMPGVRHIGLPTAADAIYMENTGRYLPSGLASLTYSIKVDRNRVRRHNEWYEPHIRWPGGAMTDEAVARWIGTLPEVSGGE